MKVAYLDCPSGVSGDMLLGALIGAGVDLGELKESLSSLGVKFDLEVKSVLKKGIRATKVDVISEEEGHVHRKFEDIKRIILASGLPDAVKGKSIEIFTLIAKAESKVHGISINEVHFHEVGAVDSIVDVVGSVLSFYMLGVDKAFSSPINVGGGYVSTAHGLLPIPAPATSLLLEGIPVYSDGTRGELATPTGVAILKAISSEFRDMPLMKVEKVSFGAGSMDLPIPNVLRLFIGELDEGNVEMDEVLLIETDIDDSTPEIMGYAVERLVELGALDVSMIPLYMKKCRPGVRLGVLTTEEKMFKLVEAVFSLTSTFGVRIQRLRRFKLTREFVDVNLGEEKVRIKLGKLGGRVLSVSPEYEDCKRVAERKGLPLKLVYKLVWDSLNKKIKEEVFKIG